MPRALDRSDSHVPAVSVVVPAFNEVGRLENSLARLLDDGFLRPGVFSELIVVDDGSTDGTAEVAERYLDGVADARVIRLPWHAGKGAAVRLGVASARGESVLFMDADLATDLSAAVDLIAALSDADVVVGSRSVPGAVVRGRSRVRGRMSRLFRRHARRLAGIEVLDPQCGFKAFRGDAAKLLFHLCSADGFGFDVELLLLARKLGFRVKEIPVEWTAVEGSKVRVWRDPVRMALEILRARLRHAGRSRPPQHPP